MKRRKVDSVLVDVLHSEVQLEYYGDFRSYIESGWRCAAREPDVIVYVSVAS
jgi:hypothetical protein